LEIFKLFGTIFIKDEEARKSLQDMDDKGKKVTKGMETMSSTVDKFGSFATKAFLGAATAAAGLLATVGTMGVKFNASMEQSAMAWETLLGGADKAKKMIEDLQKFGAETPFEFEGIDKAAKTMLAMGFSATSILPNMKKVGDAVSAIGGTQETLEGVTMALGQMLTKGKVSAEEMNQLAERGIPAWDIMAQKMGMSKQQLMELSAQGKIFSEQAVPALIDGMGERFSGAMEKQSKTFNGMLSTMKDNLKMMMGEATKPLFEAFTQMMPQVMASLDQLGQWVTNHMPEIQAFTEKAISAAIGLFNTLIQVIGFCIEHFNALAVVLGTVVAAIAAFKIIQTIIVIMEAWRAVVAIVTAAQVAWNVAMLANPIGIVIASIGALIAVGVLLYTHWDVVKEKMTALWQWIKDHWEMILFAVAPPIGALVMLGQTIIENWDKIKAAGAALKDFLVNDVWGGIVNNVKWAVNEVIGLVNSLVNKLNSVKINLPKIMGGGSIGLDIPNIPAFAKGTDFFRGGLALVGEQGPELVNLPQGSQVKTNQETKDIMSNNNPEYINNTIILDGRVIAEVVSKHQQGKTRQRGRGLGLK
jgi:tape measure domain-containing protein